MVHRLFKLSQIVFLLGSENAYGSPPNKVTMQCFDISYVVKTKSLPVMKLEFFASL